MSVSYYSIKHHIVNVVWYQWVMQMTIELLLQQSLKIFWTSLGVPDSPVKPGEWSFVCVTASVEPGQLG